MFGGSLPTIPVAFTVVSDISTPTPPNSSDVVGLLLSPPKKTSTPSLDTWKKFIKFNGSTNLELMYQLYVTDMASWGDEWLTFVCTFVDHEEARGKPAGTFASPSCPAEVNRWVAGGCRKTPVLDPNFGDRLTAWWCALQPEGRVPFTTIAKNNTHIWTKLSACGSNGFLSFVTALLWWRQHAENMCTWTQDCVKWMDLLANIQSVMEFVQHTTFEPASKRGKKSVKAAVASEPPCKQYECLVTCCQTISDTLLVVSVFEWGLGEN
jgi:hypothetical protein